MFQVFHQRAAKEEEEEENKKNNNRESKEEEGLNIFEREVELALAAGPLVCR